MPAASVRLALDQRLKMRTYVVDVPRPPWLLALRTTACVLHVRTPQSRTAETHRVREGSKSVTDIGSERPSLTEIGLQPPLGEYVRRVWGRRDFILTIPLGQLRAQNQNSVLGSAWHLLNPLLLAFVFYLVFGVLFDAGRSIDNFAAFLIIGVFVFTFTQKVVVSGARSITSNMLLIRSVSFPRVCLPLATSLGETFAQLAAVGVMLFVVLLTGVEPSITWLLLAPVLVMQTVFSVGLALVVARLTFHYRDIENLMPFVFRLWMYLSGVFFSIDFVIRQARERGVEWVVPLAEANPLYVYMTLARNVVIDVPAPASSWAYGGGWALISLAFGFWFFREHESEYGRG
jgi:teichoic acid transport system permease protein